MRDSNLAWARGWDVWIALCATGAALYAPVALVLDFPQARRIGFELFFTVMFAADAVAPSQPLRRRAEATATFGQDRRLPVVRLAVDVLAALPFSLVLGPTVLQLLRLLKLYRVAQLLHRWRFHQIQLTTVLRLVFFLYWMALLTHWVTCGWIALRGPAADPDNWHRYVAGLYWCVTTLSTVGYGDVIPENDVQKLFAIAVMMLGVGVYGFVIGNVASILASIDPGRVSHLQRIDQLSAFMSYRNIPSSLQRRIGDYYRYLWQQRLDHDETELLSRLPPSLRTEVSLYLKRDLLQAVPLFRDASESFLREIAMEMKPVVFMPGDYVIHAGERGREMYFISRGSVEVLSPDDGKTVLNRLTCGDFFGEIALLEDRPRTASVRALEYCDLYRLDKDLFARVLAHYPEIAGEIRARGEERQAPG